MSNLIDEAIGLLNEMEYEKGIDLLESILSDDPKNETALYNLALAYNSVNKPESAIKTFEYYLKNYPKTGSVLAGYGYSFYLNKENDKAKTILEEAVSLEPKNIYALRNLGRVLAETGEYERARNIFEDLLIKDPKDYRCLTGLGIIYFMKDDFMRSENYFYQVMALPLSNESKDAARSYLAKIAEKTMKRSDFRIDVVMYLVSAIKKYKEMNFENIKKLTFEISNLDQDGLDINNPDKKYSINTLDEKEMTGLCAVCYMYVGFQIINPSLNIGLDLSKEYDHAKKLVISGLI